MSEFRHPVEGYVFVVTYGRSGSTLLQNVINALPGCLLRGENNNALFPLYKSWRALVRSPDICRMVAAGEVSDPTHPWFGAEAIDPHAYASSLCANFARHVLRSPPDIRICGFKEIRTIAREDTFLDYLEFIHGHFPNARFVFNTRNHAAVVKSSWWRQHDPAEVEKMMHSAESVFAQFAKAHQDCSVRLHYDTYTADQSALEPLFDLLGRSPSRERLHDVMRTRLTHAT
ncbi:MAG: hypothetical protein EA407_10230 [Rhodobacteraceae bacterium]|nr:MAG: hypothetical protein EA407_10230 [Paracoccaceae bacterium]